MIINVFQALIPLFNHNLIFYYKNYIKNYYYRLNLQIFNVQLNYCIIKI